MGFFHSIFRGKKFDPDAARRQSEATLRETRRNRLQESKITIAALKKSGATDESRLKLEYTFGARTGAQAAELSEKLAEMGYTKIGRAVASSGGSTDVRGLTTRILLDDSLVLQWAMEMCDLGHQYGCQFSGWGANPNQP